MTVSIKTLQSLLPLITSQKNPVLIRGRHGIGKSEIVYQFAKEIGKKVVEKRASQMTEGDWTGLPDKDVLDNEKRTEWCIPNFLLDACKEGVILFLDEIDRASIEVRQGIFQLADSRRIDRWTLHPDTLLFAACNGGEYTAQYQVGEMDPAELDRWTVIDLEPTTDEFINWGKQNGVHSLVLQFINEHHRHLEHSKDYEPNKVYPTRRSWKRLNDCLIKSDLLNEKNKDNALLVSLATSYIGFEGAIAFADYLKNYTFAISPEDILLDGKIEKIKDFKITDYLALLEKIELSPLIKVKLTKKQATNLSNFFVVIPSELALKVITALGQATQDSTIVEHNLKELYKVKDNQAQKHMQKLLSDPELVEQITKEQQEKKE